MLLRQRSLLPAITAAALLTSCGPPPAPPSPVASVDSSLLPFLLDPVQDCPAAESSGAEATSISRQLRIDGDAASALAKTERLREADRASLALRIVRGQALLIAGRPSESHESLRGSEYWLDSCPPLALVYGRAAEEAGEYLEAFELFLRVRGRSEAAATRLREISDRALEEGGRRFTEEVTRGRLEQAAETAQKLQQFWPQSEIALRAEMDVGRRLDDPARELAAVRALQVARPEDRDLAMRRGRLEIEAGDPRVGLRLIEELAAASPGDSELAAEVARARFDWRLLNAPERVRSLGRKSSLTRADFAMLLYWMVPQVRTVRVADARIASDVLDHPAREEIVRIVNLGVMTVDESLHRFVPEAPLRRSEAVASLVRLLREVAVSSCAGPRGGGREAVCSAGLACGIARDSADCQSGTPVSGREAIGMLTIALDRLDGS
ncbi:MAG: tetratricopeptide repeat protein [Thermoanaerobaculia bacterium]